MIRQPLLLHLSLHFTSTHSLAHKPAHLLRKQNPTNHLKPVLCRWGPVIIRPRQRRFLLVLALHPQSIANRKSFNQGFNAAVQEVGGPIVWLSKADQRGVLSRFFTFTCWALLGLFLKERDKGDE